jgi:hypothetical protein
LITKETIKYEEEGILFSRIGDVYQVKGLGNTWTYTQLRPARQAFYYLLKAAEMIKNIKN